MRLGREANERKQLHNGGGGKGVESRSESRSGGTTSTSTRTYTYECGTGVGYPPIPEHTHPSPSNGQNSMIPGSGGTLPQVATVDLLGIEEEDHGFGSPADSLPPTSDMSDVALDAAQSDMPSDDAAQWTDGMFPHVSLQNPETELSLSNIP